MTCSDVLKFLSARLDHALNARQDALVKDHLAVCPHCREEARVLSLTWEALRAAPDISLSGDFRARFWAKVRATERAAEAPRWAWVPALAGFLALWILGVAGTVRWNESRRASPAETTVNDFLSPVPQNSIESIFLTGRSPSESHGGSL